MMDRDETARSAILSKLAQSREEVRRLLEPPPRTGRDGTGPNGASGGFPRSRTMQMLMSGKGLGTVGAVASGLLIARPALAFRLLKLLPVSAVARTLLIRAVTTWRSKQRF